MRTSSIFTLISAAVLLAAGSLLAEKPQTNCPVMGGKINKEVYVDYQGSRVYFCCPGCKGSFLAKPDSFLTSMKQQGILPEKTPNPQTLCPVMGNEINRQVFADYDGKRVYFCCEDCREKFKAEPEKYLKKLKDQGVNLDDSPSLERFERGASEGEKHPEQH